MVVAAGLLAVRGAPGVPLPAIFDVVTDNCIEFAPKAVHVPFIDPGDQVTLDIYLVGEEVTNAEALSVVDGARAAFAPLGVTLATVGWKTASFTTDDSQGIIDQTKALLGGERPAGSDMVWTFTRRDITAPGVGDTVDVIGQADCIGGIRWPNRSFLVGEYSSFNGFGFGPVRMQENFYGKLFAHEAGHLLGAHHHYANCAEGVPSEVSAAPLRVEVSPCTLMTNFVDVSSINLSTASALVARAHAEEYGRP